ncbi:MAG: hypothetical protein GXO79_13695 [Chlorobi bacterium]|nr:hypothetical protein [Chlorobiota bacterium]
MENLDKEKSLDIITEMINRAKGNIQSEYIFFLIWGWVIALASIAHFSIIKFTNYPHPEIAWSLIIVGIVLSGWHGYKIGKKTKVKTYADSVYSKVWLVFLINYFIILLFMKTLNYNITPVILLLAGGSTFLSGIVINFKPLIYGGILLWIAAVVSFIFSGEIQLLVSGISIMIGYLIPGYMLKSKNKKSNV